jgi:hypothetical protein
MLLRSARHCAIVLTFGVAPAVGHASPAQPAAQPSASIAGRIKVASGTATIVRGTETRAATVGAEVVESDVLRTGADGRISLMLKDESRLSLGPNTELALTRFAFAPHDRQLGLAVRVSRGVLSYVSGLIAKLAPEAVRLQTPTSIIGVRGTHVLVRADAL